MCLIVIWSMTDHTYHGGFINYNGAEQFLSPSDIIAIVMLQHQVIHVYSDVGVNKPTALLVI